MRYKLGLAFVIFLKIHLFLTENSSEDYALLAQRRMQYDIKVAAVQIGFVKDRYDDMIEVIKDRQQRVVQEINQAEEYLTLIQYINSTYRSCIKTYRPQLYSKDQAQGKFDACLNAAEDGCDKRLMDVHTPLNFAKNTADVLLPISVEKCQECASNGEPEEECVIEKVEEHTESFDEDLNSSQDKLEVNLGISSLIVRKAMECSFEAEKKVLVKLGSVLQLIDICVGGGQLLSAIRKIAYN